MSDSKVWAVLLFIILLFAGVVFFARQVTVTRQEEYQPVVARYSNYTYAVSLRYPPEWQPVTTNGFDRYEGRDGFFSVSAGGGETTSLADMVENETNHPLKPYGTTPTVLELKIDGEDARLIMPSLDQEAAMHGQAVLLVRYPQPIIIGGEKYRYLVFWADRAHIQDIASSISIIRQ